MCKTVEIFYQKASVLWLTTPNFLHMACSLLEIGQLIDNTPKAGSRWQSRDNTDRLLLYFGLHELVP